MRRWGFHVVAVLAVAACSSTDDAPGPASLEKASDPPYVPAPESCSAPALDRPTAFVPCTTGGGIFGAWTLDADGMPAYDYGLDQNADERARWENTEEQDRRHHWASFGNARVTAMVSNDGWIEVTTQDRGVTYLNKVDETASAFGGGFSFVDDGEATWTTAYKWRPRGSKTTRRFGMGYAESSMLHRGTSVARVTYAPKGDQPFVIDEVTIENTTDTPRSIRHYEYWDVRRRPIEIEWLVSGKTFPIAPQTVATHRDARNAMFDESVSWDPGARLLGLRRNHAPGASPAPLAPEAPSPIDFHPGDPFLAVLAGDVADVYTDDASFFGEGGAARPRAVVERAAGELARGSVDVAPKNGLGQPRMFALRTDLALAPHEKKTLRFAYGYTPMHAPFPSLAETTDPARSARAEARAELGKHLLWFASDREPFLHRELAWHASQIEASVAYREYWGRHVVPQGSAYLYLHGADGALRDTALFAMPLVYTHPSLAKEQLSLAMGMAFAADSRFSYSFQGHGMLDDALGLHSRPSDLDLFYLAAMIEYLGATGDVAYLGEKISYYPRAPENEATVLDHVRRAVIHLFDGVGFGEHGLLRIGTGDWSDGIVATSPNRALAMEKGESVPNSQMALAVLPHVATLLEGSDRDPALAKRIRDALEPLARAVDATWTGSQYGRAYFGDGVLHGAQGVDLEAQVWSLLAATPRAQAALTTVATELDDRSKVGAPLTPGGQVWPAISQLLTWGYGRLDDERAFGHLARNSLAARAQAHPDVWFHVWSGPDGANASDGRTWSSPVTPMTDFPTMNNNVHAMAMLGALRVAGLEARPTGLAVFPHVPSRRLALRTELVDLDQDPAHLRIVWRAKPGVARTLSLTPPRGQALVEVKVDGVVSPCASTGCDLLISPRDSGATIDATLAQ